MALTRLPLSPPSRPNSKYVPRPSSFLRVKRIPRRLAAASSWSSSDEVATRRMYSHGEIGGAVIVAMVRSGAVRAVNIVAHSRGDDDDAHLVGAARRRGVLASSRVGRGGVRLALGVSARAADADTAGAPSRSTAADADAATATATAADAAGRSCERRAHQRSRRDPGCDRARAAGRRGQVACGRRDGRAARGESQPRPTTQPPRRARQCPAPATRRPRISRSA
jgi:hypothetical protein